MKPDQLAASFLALYTLAERAVDALEKLAGSSGFVAGNSPVPQPPDTPEEVPAPKPANKRGPKTQSAPAGPTPEELLAKMSELVTPAMEKDPSLGAKFRNVAIKHGAERFSEIPVANLPAALADVEALCEGSVNSATKLF